MKSLVQEDVERIAGAPESKMKPEAMTVDIDKRDGHQYTVMTAQCI